MEIIAFERGIRCNPPPSLSKVVQDRPKSEILIYFQSGSTPRFIETRTGFPPPSGGKVVLSKAGGGIRARGEKEAPPPPPPPDQRGPIFFRQYWPSLYSGRRRGGGGRGPKNSCGFHVARKRRRNNVDTGRVANPGCSTRRLDYTADLSERHWVR